MQDIASRQMNLDPNEMANRLMQRAHNRDGLPEMAIGSAFLIVAFVIFLQSRQAAGSLAYKSLALGWSVLVPALGAGLPAAIKWLRRRHLIHRFGYLETTAVRKRSLLVGLLLAAGIAALIGVARFSIPDQWVLAGAGLFAGTLCAFCGKLIRFAVYGVLIAAAGLFIAQIRLSLLSGFPLLFGFCGGLLLLSGILVFVRYMRSPAERIQ